MVAHRRARRTTKKAIEKTPRAAPRLPALGVAADRRALLAQVERHGTPILVIDHDVIRRNYRRFRKHLPRVQCYYAVKANSDPEIIKTMFDEGASFDVASFPEFLAVHKHIARWPDKKRFDYIWDRIIFSNTIKDIETLMRLRPYRPLVAFDNEDELVKIKRHCDTAGLILRLTVSDTGSVVELNSKFGVAPAAANDLIEKAFAMGMTVEGLSFHVGSQCMNLDNYVEALHTAHEIFTTANRKRTASQKPLNLINMGGGYPAPYDRNVPRFEELAKLINSEIARLFPEKTTEILAEPGRFIVATAGTLVSEIIGRARRDGRRVYHINDGLYHDFSAVLYDHWTPNFQAFRHAGRKEICAVVGPTCDSFDKVSLHQNLPANLIYGDLLYTLNIGAYSSASASHFNGFPPATVVHVNTRR
ncbi:MAG: type III PLP-dependent enzyme [bacterium]